MPEAAKAHTDAGAVAFAKYYIDVLNDLYKRPRVGVIEKLSAPGCKSCGAYVRTVKRLDTKNLHYSTDAVTVKSASAKSGGPQPVVEMAIVQNAASLLTATGTVDSTVARGESPLYVTLNRTGDGWNVAEVQI